MWAKILLLAVAVNLCYCKERVHYSYKPIYREHGGHEKYVLRHPSDHIHREPAPIHEEQEPVVLKHEHNYFVPEINEPHYEHVEYKHPVSYKQYYHGYAHEEYPKQAYAHPHSEHIPEDYHHAPTRYAPEHESEQLALHHIDSHSHDEPIDYYGYPKYEYEYKVEDLHTGDNKFQHEFRDGDKVKGVYSLLEPDGSIRIVEYSSDKHHGFNAVVKHTHPSQHLETPHEV